MPRVFCFLTPISSTPHPLPCDCQYLIRVRQNIHVVVTMSPMGEQFRSRLRMFPGLVNCCTIDWFGAWPGECATCALLQMACIAVQFSLKQLTDAF